MIVIVLCIVVYIMGIKVCRDVLIKADKEWRYYDPDGVDVLMCIMPICHWLWAFSLYVDMKEDVYKETFVDKIVDKFFERDK